MIIFRPKGYTHVQNIATLIGSWNAVSIQKISFGCYSHGEKKIVGSKKIKKKIKGKSKKKNANKSEMMCMTRPSIRAGFSIQYRRKDICSLNRNFFMLWSSTKYQPRFFSFFRDLFTRSPLSPTPPARATARCCNWTGRWANSASSKTTKRTQTAHTEHALPCVGVPSDCVIGSNGVKGALPALERS